MSADRKIAFRWAASSFFGWGIYGLNLMLHWPQPALTAHPIDRIVLAREDQRRRVAEMVRASEQFHAQLKPFANSTVVSEMPVFVSYGNDLERYFAIHQVDVFGTPSIAFAFLEDAAIATANVAGVNQLPLMIAGSSWNAELMRAAGVKNVAVVLQGVDGELFRPRPSTGRFAGRFVVFSGGQSSIRKAQDLVLVAFRAFAERHRDALLIAAWHSPWVDRAQSFATPSSRLPPPPIRPDGKLDPTRWAIEAGIPAEQFLDLGSLPNCELPLVLAEANVALFPNRAEGGTNLIAMECLASGIPTILSANTGHLDLISRTGTFAATRQRRVAAAPKMRSTEGWGESDIEELVELLENVYAQPGAATARAAGAARAMRALTWERQIQALYAIVSPLL
jgi:glycosyltransferase involved in cell wall biosynthesis